MLIEEMRAQWVNHRIAEFDKELAQWARNDETARRLMTFRGSAC
jgi:hypothetical protein